MKKALLIIRWILLVHAFLNFVMVAVTDYAMWTWNNCGWRKNLIESNDIELVLLLSFILLSIVERIIRSTKTAKKEKKLKGALRFGYRNIIPVLYVLFGHVTTTFNLRFERFTDYIDKSAPGMNAMLALLTAAICSIIYVSSNDICVGRNDWN